MPRQPRREWTQIRNIGYGTPILLEVGGDRCPLSNTVEMKDHYTTDRVRRVLLRKERRKMRNWHTASMTILYIQYHRDHSPWAILLIIGENLWGVLLVDDFHGEVARMF